MTNRDQLLTWLANRQPTENLRAAIRQSPATPRFLAAIRREVPDLRPIPALTYTLYREFEHSGARGGYETPYFTKRAQLTRAVLEVIMGDAAQIDAVHDLAWSICEESSWVLPAHEEQGPLYWDLDPPRSRTQPLGAHTALTRPPDSIDLFAAETAASLAEAVYLLGDEIAPEVRQRIRQEVGRHVFAPYLARARDHWWFHGALNWNGVVNGAVALAFLRLENDLPTLAQALELALEGIAAYIATGFEADGGSIEGVGYWNYGLLYTVSVAELLREISGGELDLLAAPRLADIARYPVGMALEPPSRFVNFGDALEQQPLAHGIAARLAERTGVDQLRALVAPPDSGAKLGLNPIHKLAIMLRNAAWWDDTQPPPPFEHHDVYLPESGVIKFTAQTGDGRTVLLAAKAGHNDGHHSHTDIATFIYNVAGDSLIPDSGRGLYAKDYFRQGRYDNVFNNSFTHNVPRIAGQLQAAGPEFGGCQQFHGTVIEQGPREIDGRACKVAVIDFHAAYDIPALTTARRTLALDVASGILSLEDTFACAEPLAIEEAFVTWDAVALEGGTARITGPRAAITVQVIEPAGAVFAAEPLEDACHANRSSGLLTRLSIDLPPGSTRFVLRMTPLEA